MFGHESLEGWGDEGCVVSVSLAMSDLDAFEYKVSKVGLCGRGVSF